MLSINNIIKKDFDLLKINKETKNKFKNYDVEIYTRNTQDDVVDALEVMGIKDEPISLEQFMDLIGIMKDPETIIDAFSVFDTDKRGVIDEDELRSILRKYAPDLKGKEIEEILEKPNVTTNGKVNYKNFVTFWSEQ